MTNKININFNLLSENAFHIISELLKAGITTAKLQIDLTLIEKDKEENLKGKLTALNVVFSNASKGEEDENNTDDDNEDISLGSFKMSAKEEAQNEEITASTIDDNIIANYFNNRRQKMHLTELIDKFKIEIDVKPREIKLSGPKSKVEKFKEEILKIKYEKSILIGKTEAKCLKQIQFIKNLKDKYETTIKFMPEGEKSRLIIYGADKTKVENCREQLEKVVGKIIILLELSTEHEVEGEVQEILKFLQEKYQKKYEGAFKKKRIECEIGKNEDPHNKKVSIFFFVKCTEEHFTKIHDYINKEMAALCILNIYPKKDKGIKVKKTENTLDDKVGIFSLKNGHYLLIGKEKHMKTTLENLPSIEAIEDQVDFFRLRFKKLPFAARNLLKEDTTKGIDASLKPDPHLTIFITNKSKVRVITDLLDKFKKQLSTIYNSTDQSSLNFSKSTDKESTASSLSKESRIEPQSPRSDKILMEPILEEEPIVKEPIIEEPIVQIYNHQNENQKPFELDTSEEACELDSKSEEFVRIKQLLEADKYKVHIEYVIKDIDSSRWEKYESIRKRYHSDTIAEYLLFYRSSEQPDEIDLEQKDQEDLKENLIDHFDKENKLWCKDSVGRNEVLATVVLLDKAKQNKILACYPAYFINFKFEN